MRKAALRKTPLLEAAEPQSDLRNIAEDPYPVSAESILEEHEVILFRRVHPDVLKVRFRSKKQGEFLLRRKLQELKDQFAENWRHTLNLLELNAKKVEKELRIDLGESRKAFLRLMKKRRLRSYQFDEGLTTDEYSRALAECLTIHVWLYGTSTPRTEEGKKRMAKVDRTKPKYLIGFKEYSDAQLVRMIWRELGSCIFTDEERIILDYCEREIREQGEDNFAFHHPLQRKAYEFLAFNIGGRERTWGSFSDIAKFRESVSRVPQPVLSGLIVPVQERRKNPRPPKAVAEGQLDLFKKNLALPPDNFVWGQQDLFERRQALLFDLEAPWYF